MSNGQHVWFANSLRTGHLSAFPRMLKALSPSSKACLGKSLNCIDSNRPLTCSIEAHMYSTFAQVFEKSFMSISRDDIKQREQKMVTVNFDHGQQLRRQLRKGYGFRRDYLACNPRIFQGHTRCSGFASVRLLQRRGFTGELAGRLLYILKKTFLKSLCVLGDPKDHT